MQGSPFSGAHYGDGSMCFEDCMHVCRTRLRLLPHPQGPGGSAGHPLPGALFLPTRILYWVASCIEGCASRKHGALCAVLGTTEDLQCCQSSLHASAFAALSGRSTCNHILHSSVQNCRELKHCVALCLQIDWDNMIYPTTVMLAMLTDNPQFHSEAQAYLQKWLCR